ncbi:MAG: DUF1553 domain-containing protein, partial [Planctomycetia bacterium]|nr:DUF1553 domain-containing protein [Planctomycetia bacterium]
MKQPSAVKSLRLRFSTVAGLVLLLAANAASAANPPAAPTKQQVEFFEKHIRPVLADHCYQCHNQAANKKKGGLTVDSLAGLLQGGDTGPALVRGEPEKSLLLKAVKQTDADLKMPPKGKLTDAQLAALEQWVKDGAPWPGATATASRNPGKITDEDRRWWAFQPVRPVAVPAVADDGWTANAIDRFILHKLQSEGLKPSPPAERRALVRRLYFDLVGMPPTQTELEAALADHSPQWYERLVEKLLGSPHYGERWARHWLDLVRYAESDGFRIDDFRPEAWRYRDYVVRAFNNDKPYNQFVREQLAGDELSPDDPDALAATGFLRHWIYEYNQRDVRTQWNNILDDLTDVTGEVFLGMGYGCARCHDHKFDPILQKDYYRLRAFFAAFLPIDDRPLATPREQDEYRAKLAAWEKTTADLRAQIEAIEAPVREKSAKAAIDKFPEDIQVMIRKPVAERTPLEHQLAELAYRQVLYEYARIETKLKDEQKQKVIELKKQLNQFQAQKPAPLPVGLTARDTGATAPVTQIPKKANLPAIEPGYLTLLQEAPAEVKPLSNSTGRRSELARWVASPDNMLTTRVIVNRVWQYHFGKGLVATASDFGRLGEKPSNPELLDWLAARFVQDGWSLKQLHRLIVNSATYRQSATHPASELALKKDPENRWHWRSATRRLDAEQIRDALLQATGELDLAGGGPGVDTSRGRRTIYTKVFRNQHDPLLEVFDLPEGFTSMPERNVTTTPTQALLLINSPYMLQRAKVMADRLLKQPGRTDEELIDQAFRLAFGRPATAGEQSKGVAFLRRQSNRPADKPVVNTVFQSEKLPYREGKAAVLQPDGPQTMFRVPMAESLAEGEFTVEAFILLRSTYEDAAVRTIAAHWNGDRKQPGWSCGVTSKRSQFKPQTLVLQLFGDETKNGAAYEAIFSGLHIALNKPYYVAVSVNLSDPDKKGITFYSKDLSNDEDPLQTARNTHQMTSRGKPNAAFTI